MDRNKLLFELVRLAIGKQDMISHTLTTEEWLKVYQAAVKQSVVGICVEGMSKLPKEQKPPMELYMQWVGTVSQIQQQNEKLDKQTAKIWKQLKDDGLDAAILKGQGIAEEYGRLSKLRQSGDIDIWVKGGYQTVCNYVQKTIPTDDLAYHRFHYNYFEDTEVELHHRPTLMRNLMDDRKLEKWYESFGAESFVYLEDKGFAVPSAEFNRIFILTHIYRHFLFEGVGLRQVMDYYFVLANEKLIDKSEKIKVMETLRALRLKRFAGAVMWVLGFMVHGEGFFDERSGGAKRMVDGHEDWMICEPDEKEGRFLLNEIMMSGNFGQADQRYQYKRLFKFQRWLSRSSHLLIHYPSEVIWSPIWIVYHWFWKKSKKREIHKQWNR